MSSDQNQLERNVDEDISGLRNAEGTAQESESIAKVFSRFRPQLERMVEFRMDRRIKSRVDANDVLQEAFINVKTRYKDFIVDPGVSLFVWIRQLTFQTLVEFQRRHFRQKRSVIQETRLNPNPSDLSDTSRLISLELAGQLTSPSQAAIKAEEIEKMHEALESMNETDREILALRHFEQLSNSEVAEIIGLKPAAASNRYIRALTRLGEIMERFQE